MAEYIERGGKLFPTPFSSEEHGDYRQGWNHCLRAIYQMPAADVKPVVRAKWEWRHRQRGGVRYFTGEDSFGNVHTVQIDQRYELDEPYCSVCGKLNDGSSMYFCPNCGADMREETT